MWHLECQFIFCQMTLQGALISIYVGQDPGSVFIDTLDAYITWQALEMNIQYDNKQATLN